MGWETVLGTRPALRLLVVGDDALRAVADAGSDAVSPTHVPDLAAALTELADRRFDCVLLELTGRDPRAAGTMSALRERGGSAAVVVVCESAPDEAGPLEDLADLVLGPDELAGAGAGALRQAAEHARLVWPLRAGDRTPLDLDPDLDAGYVVPSARPAPDGPVRREDDVLAGPGPARGSGAAGPDEDPRALQGMFTLGDDGSVASWTDGAAALYGYTAAEVVGRDAAVLHPLSSTDVGPFLVAGREGGAVLGHDTICRTRDGRLVPVTLDAAPQVDGHGKPVGWVVLARTTGPR